MNRIVGLLLAAVLLAAIPLGDAFGRGFGGFGGGFRGGFGGGGFGGGGLGGGGWGGGGFRDRGFDGGGFGGFGDRGFGGFRDDGGGMQGRVYHPQPDRSFSADTWRSGGAHDSGRMRDEAGSSRAQLDRFLGMPGDAGLGHIAGTRDRAGVEGTRVTAGRVEGPFGGSAAFVSGTHVRYVPPGVLTNQGWAVRNAFNDYNLFTPAWYTAHRGAWIAPGLAASAWAPASWFGLADWVGCDSSPTDYDYGSTVTYQGDNVYVEGQPVGSAAQYYDQAGSLAASGAATQDDQDQAQWMSLGVFGLVQVEQNNPSMIFQLAVNRQGIIRGNCYNTLTDTTLPVRGAVDKKTQRVAWTMGDNKNTVIDTGLYNLTKDEAPVLVHFGKERTQDWLIVRLDKTGAKSDS